MLGMHPAGPPRLSSKGVAASDLNEWTRRSICAIAGCGGSGRRPLLDLGAAATTTSLALARRTGPLLVLAL
jgi:hypothetical protein